LNYISAGPLSVPVPATGTGTKRKILAGPESGPKKKYRDRDRDQIKRVTGTKKSWSRTSLVNTHIHPPTRQVLQSDPRFIRRNMIYGIVHVSL
jgi:hypothetical protein